jgi:hypothetical protein
MLIRSVGVLVASLMLTALSTPVTAASSSTARNRAPTLHGTASRPIFVGQTYRFQPTAQDADGDTVTFTIANKPAWATFNSRTGLLTGTPNAKQAGFYHDIRIAATDGKAVTRLSAFMIYVKHAPARSSSTAPNHAPTIHGTAPRPIFAGQTYRFQPTAQDADGDRVTFTIANKPGWATFDSRTGLLTGTPNGKQTGFYKEIEIAATDGKAVTPLSAFMIYVKHAPAETGSPNVALEWRPPSENVDGSSLTNLKGYTLYYGQKSKTYTDSIKIDNPSVLNYVVEGLPKGTYFFVLTAYNTQGAESDYSDELSRTVN